MEREGVLNGGRSAIDWFGSGSSTMERDRTRSLRGHLGSGGDRVDGGSSMERSHTRPMVGLGSGNATAPDASNGSQDKARRGNGNPGDEDVVMINDSPTTEATWKGLLNNDIYHIWNHGPKIGGGFDCRYCRLKTRGGGATRFREHLAGIPGDVRECPNVPRNVRAAMRESRDVTMLKKREKASHWLRIERGIIEGMYPGVINLEDDDQNQIQMSLREQLRDKNVSRAVERRRGSGSGVRVSLGKRSITAYFDKELSSNKVQMQPKISTALNIESKDVLGQSFSKRLQKDTLMVAAAVLDPYTHYQNNLSKITEYASALTDAIQKIADPDTAVLAINEVITYRECRGRFGQRLARSSAQNMAPTEWWFQFGGEVPNLQKCALRIVSQCVSSSGCERNWSAFALVHTKQRNRLLYGKLHKCVSVRHNLKIRAEEDQDHLNANYRVMEVDPCAMMMDTAMYDASNPMMEWLMEDEENIILDGTDAASAVFEELRSLNSRRKESPLGTKDNGRKRKRAVEEEEEDDYQDWEDEDDEENEIIDVDDGQDEEDDYHDSESAADGQGVPSQVEKDANQVEKDIEGTSDGSLGSQISARLRKGKKVKNVSSLYK